MRRHVSVQNLKVLELNNSAKKLQRKGDELPALVLENQGWLYNFTPSSCAKFEFSYNVFQSTAANIQFPKNELMMFVNLNLPECVCQQVWFFKLQRYREIQFAFLLFSAAFYTLKQIEAYYFQRYKQTGAVFQTQMCLYVPDLETRATEELRFTGSLCALMILVKLFRFDRREWHVSGENRISFYCTTLMP